jgi:hypothetical protein
MDMISSGSRKRTRRHVTECVPAEAGLPEEAAAFLVLAQGQQGQHTEFHKSPHTEFQLFQVATRSGLVTGHSLSA